VSSDETLLAFDFGEKRIGVAVGNGLVRVARGLKTLHVHDNVQRFAAVTALIADWQPQRLVVGIARATDGTAHEMTRRCERFANQLHGRFGLPVERVDERYSSTSAESQLRTDRRTTRRSSDGADTIDAEAAAIILQAWFDQRDVEDNGHA